MCRLQDLAHVTLKWQDSDDELGHFDFDCGTITLTRGMTQAEQRCTLTHELIHIERGPVAVEHREAEERVVRDLTARRLITDEALVNALAESFDEWDLAEALWADVEVVRDRLRFLTAAERAQIDAEIWRREVHIP
jgi:hypothetical protein